MRAGRVYVAGAVAGPGANIDGVREIQAAFRAAGWTVTYDWTEHGVLTGCGEMRRARAALDEVAGVASANVLVVRLPGFRGTHVELGIAIGAGIPVLIVAESPQARLDERGVECAFYSHPSVSWVYGVSSPAVIVKIAAELARHAGRAIQ